jgi:hypothetical protein
MLNYGTYYFPANRIELEPTKSTNDNTANNDNDNTLSNDNQPAIMEHMVEYPVPPNPNSTFTTLEYLG